MTGSWRHAEDRPLTRWESSRAFGLDMSALEITCPPCSCGLPSADTQAALRAGGVVMPRDALALVFKLAVLTDDRTAAEADALKAVASVLDAHTAPLAPSPEETP